MDKKTINILNCFSSEIRKTMNSMIDEINDDYTGWCELASMLMYRLVNEKLPQIKENNFIHGEFNGEGHCWNIIDDIIVDLTLDQFGNYKAGLINKKWYGKYTVEKVNDIEKVDLIHMTEEFIDFINIDYLVY